VSQTSMAGSGIDMLNTVADSSAQRWTIRRGGCSSAGRASRCGRECRGFKSRHSPHEKHYLGRWWRIGDVLVKSIEVPGLFAILSFNVEVKSTECSLTCFSAGGTVLPAFVMG
jgi:hypothetical protein